MVKKTEETSIQYKFDEDRILKELSDYIDATYGQHYSKNQFQASEFIVDCGHGEGFFTGSILKYAQRLGHKGKPEDWRKDLFKIVHYAMLAIHVHDKENPRGDNS